MKNAAPAALGSAERKICREVMVRGRLDLRGGSIVAPPNKVRQQSAVFAE
jgi:hypothetical protein